MMPTENPYSSPQAESLTGANTTAPQNLREIALAQRQVNIAVLLYLCLIPINIGLSGSADWAGIVVFVMALSVFAFGAVSVYRLAAIFRGRTVAVIHAVGLLVPLLGLILLFTNSQKATKILQANGIKVGLLGANPKAL